MYNIFVLKQADTQIHQKYNTDNCGSYISIDNSLQSLKYHNSEPKTSMHYIYILKNMCMYLAILLVTLFISWWRRVSLSDCSVTLKGGQVTMNHLLESWYIPIGLIYVGIFTCMYQQKSTNRRKYAKCININIDIYINHLFCWLIKWLSLSPFLPHRQSPVYPHRGSRTSPLPDLGSIR